MAQLRNVIKYSGSVSAEQKKELIHFIECHPELKSGKFSNEFSWKTAQNLWMHVAEHLNALPGAKKEWKQWRKTWQDMKSTAKRKKTQLKNQLTATGGGPQQDIIITEEDDQILDLVGSVAVEGDQLVLDLP
uniref:Regulatory protein zeste n=1 Tax=Diabrotica virgifera virgifera TaxID=50390 RepID=A0A6P7HDD5_DIAVI